MNAPIRAVVLLSGGLDSLLSLAELVAKPVHEVERVHALIFAYGQSSSAEVSSAAKVCEAWGVNYTVRTLSNMQTDTTKEIPARNLVFIAHAAAFAVELGFNCIVIGTEPDSTFTDSSVRFIEETQRVVGLFGLSLLAPVKALPNKVALVKRALDLGVPLHLCHSSRSEVVDGNCKTSRLFLDSISQIFPHCLDPLLLLQELSSLVSTQNKVSASVYYAPNHSFKYAAALFSVVGREEFHGSVGQIEILSTGSWMRDIEAVLALPPGLYSPVVPSVYFTKTGSIQKLMSQLINCDSTYARWGIKQSLSLLKRARYSPYVACRQTQGHLAASLLSLGYSIASPVEQVGVLLETEHE